MRSILCRLIPVAGLTVALSGCAEPIRFGTWRSVFFGFPLTWFGLVTLLAIGSYVLMLRAEPKTPFEQNIGHWLARFAGGMASLYVAGWIFAPTTVYTFRVTVDVDVDGELKSGSSVLEVINTKGWLRWFTSPNPVLGTGGSLDVRGTAPIVDLGRYGSLIASLSPRHGGPTGQYDGKHAAKSLHQVSYLHGPKGEISIDPGPRVVKPGQYPQFVWIPADDPERALPLSPGEFAHHVGPGVRIVTVSIAPTSDAVMTVVDPAPKWLTRLRERRTLQSQGSLLEDGNRFYLYTHAIETRR